MASPQVNSELLAILEANDRYGQELREETEVMSPDRQLLFEVQRAMGLNKQFQPDPTIVRQPPGRETLQRAGVPLPQDQQPEAQAAPEPEKSPVMQRVENTIDFAKSTGLMILRAPGELAKQIFSSSKDVRASINELLGKVLPAEGMVALDMMTRLQTPAGSVGEAVEKAIDPKNFGEFLDSIVRAPQGQYEEGVVQVAGVLIAMLPMIKGLQALGMSARAATLTAGPIVEAVAIDPNSPGFVDAIGMLSPGIQQEVKAFIRSGVPDDEAEQTFHDRLRLRGFRALTDGVVADGLWNVLGKVVLGARRFMKFEMAPPIGGTVHPVTPKEPFGLLPDMSLAARRQAVEGAVDKATRETAEAARQAAEATQSRAVARVPEAETAVARVPEVETVVGEVVEEGGQRALPPGPGPRAALPPNRAIASLPPPAVAVADDALDALGKLKANVSPGDLDAIASTVAAKHGIPEAEARRLIDTGLDVMREARNKLGNSQFDRLLTRDKLTLGALLAAVTGSQLADLPEDDDRVLNEAGIGFQTLGRILKGLGKQATEEEVEKLTFKRRFIRKGEAVREATEEAEAQAAEFSMDRPSRVVTQGKPFDVNFNVMAESPEEFRRVIDQVSQIKEGEIEAWRRTNRGERTPAGQVSGVNREAEAELARNMGLKIEQLHEFAKATELFPKMVIAANEMLVASAKRLNDLRVLVLKGDTNAYEPYLEQFIVHGEIQQSVAKVRSEVGRSLGMYNVKVDGNIELLHDVRKSMLKQGKSLGKTVQDLARMHSAMTPAEVAKMSRDMTSPTTLGAIQEYFYGSILSASQGVNLQGNMFTAFMEPIERLEVAALHGLSQGARNMAKRLRGEEIGTSGFRVFSQEAQEAKEWAVGWFGAFGDAMSLMSRALRTEQYAFEGSKLGAAHQPQITAELFGADPSTFTGGTINMVGKAIRTIGPGFLRSTDDAFKLMAMRGELRAAGYREGIAKGLEGDDLAAFMQKFVDNPTDEALENAMKKSQVLTFSNALSDPEASFQTFRALGAKLQAWTAEHPGAKFLLPFVRAGVNMPTYSMERAPGINLMSRQMWRNLRSTDPRIRAEAQGKIATSGTMLGLVSILSYSGMVTGQGPTDPKRRAELEKNLGVHFNSIYVPGLKRWIELDRADPMGWMLSTTATVVQSVIGNPRIPEEDQTKIIHALTLANAEMLSHKSYMYGVSMVLDAIRGGRFAQGDLSGAEKVGMNFIAGLAIPNAISRLRQTVDPIKREYDGLMGPILNRIPWYSKSAPAEYNDFGDEVAYTYASRDYISPAMYFVAPYAVSKLEQPKYSEVVLQHNLRLPSAGGMLNGVRIDARGRNPAWESRLKRIRGHEIKIGGKTMTEAIAALPDLAVWKRLGDGPEGGKQWLLNETVEPYTQMARIKLLREFDDLRTLIREHEKTAPERFMPR